MDLKLISLFLFGLLANIISINCLDFSQFYLPECCYIPPPSNSIVHEQSPSTRHDIKARKADSAHLINLAKSNATQTNGTNPRNSNVISTAESSNKNSKVSSATRLYRYIIPLKKSDMEALDREALNADDDSSEDSSSASSSASGETEDVETTKTKTTTTPATKASLPTTALMRENGVKMRKSLQKSMKLEKEELSSTDKLFSSAQVESELKPKLVMMMKNRNNKNNLTKINISDDDDSQLPSIESILFSKNTSAFESMLKFKRNTNNNNNNNSSLIVRRRSSSTTSGKKENNKGKDMMQTIQRTLKMPGNWVTNLRRALYQSMDSMINRDKQLSKSKSGDDETILTKSSNYNPRQRSSNEEQAQDEQVTMLWNKLREANFTLVEPLTRSSTSIPSTLYLPTGQGPIASGVVVNTVNGIQLRMAADLNFRQDEPKTSESNNNLQNIQNDCNCHLIHNGEILMAYWSVSRIVNENGQPALQYLIYPVPHNVPTPPVMIPFAGDKTFNAAQYDPIHGNNHNRNPHQPGYALHKYNHNQQQQQIHHHNRHPQQQQSHSHPGLQHHNVPTGYRLHPLQPHQQNEQYEFHHLQEVPIDIDIDNRQPPAPNPLAFPPNHEQVFQNIQHFNQLPPGSTSSSALDDRNGYRGVVIENGQGYTPEFINIYKQALENHLLQGGVPNFPNPNLDHKGQGNFPPHHGGSIPQSPPPPGNPLENPLYGNINKHFGISPPSHIQLFDGNKSPPGFPKSIQDILSPFPAQISLPENGGPGFPTSPGPGSPLLQLNQQQEHHHQIHHHGPGDGSGDVGEEYHGVINYQSQQFGGFPQQQHHHHQGPPPPTTTAVIPHKNYDVNNFYSFRGGKDGGSRGHSYAGNPITGSPHSYPKDYPTHHQLPPLNLQHNQNHNIYPPNRPATYLSSSDIGQDRDRHRHGLTRPGTFAGSNDDDINRYHHQHQQQLPTRHRSEKYTRPPPHDSQRSSGSYILNF